MTAFLENAPKLTSKETNKELPLYLKEIMDMPILFGLEAQGHIPTIEKMLSEGKSWEEIGKTIGWCHDTAKEHYERYLSCKKS